MKAQGNSKYCPRCDITKTISDFHKNRCTSDGLAGFCKECMAELHRQLKDKPDHRDRAKVLQKRYRSKSKNKKRQSLFKRKWSIHNRHKASAHRAVLHGLRKGTLKKLPCEICGELKVEAHHEDYSKPLDVIWLCRMHHLRVHHRKDFANTFLSQRQ